MSTKPILSILVLGAALVSTPALAGIAVINGTVDRVMIDNTGNFGGCMAKLSVDPQSALPACGPTWVSFSCTGDFADQVSAYRSLDQAQLALATNKRVMVVIDDGRRQNGYCFVTRIDIVR